MRTIKTIIMAGLFALLAVSALTTSAALAQNSNVAVESAERDRYIVVFNDTVGNPAAAAAALARQHGFAVRQVYTTALKGFAASLPERAVAALSRDGRVKYVEADQLAHATAAQVIPTGVRRISADNFNTNLTIDGTDDLRIDVGVAVVDTGVAFNPEINLVEQVDCIGNPFNETCTPGSGNDGNGHGTHVAGTIGAIDNGDDVVGVAPGARIWGIKVLKDSGSGWISNIVGGIDWIAVHNQQNAGNYEQKIAVANMSLGGGNSTALCDAIRASVLSGVTYAVAAGNDDADAANSSPANCKVVSNSANNAADGIITVSALADFNGLPNGGAAATCRSDVDDTLANFSNWGSYIDIAAPGVCILSTWNDGTLNTISGTSMATPHVTGAAALLAAVGDGGVPPSPHTIHMTLVNNGGDPNGWTDDSGDDTQEPLLDVSDSTVFHPETVAGSDFGGPINNVPTVSISSPSDTDPPYASGATISFNGSASDVEDGGLTGSLQWTSSIDGPIGSGGSFNTSLRDGPHTITASVTDSGGATGTASVSITVGNPPSGVTMYVADITMVKKGPNLDTTVTIRADTDGSGSVTGADAPVAGVVPDVKLCNIDTAICYFTGATIATDSAGQTKYKLLKPTKGDTYTMTVLDVADSSNTYLFGSVAGEANNPSDPFVIP